MKDDLVVVTGGGGFIGGHMVADLRRQGYTRIRAVDIKPLDEWYQSFDDVENLSLDLDLKENCETAAAGARQVYNLAANMGGMGFIENNKALCMLTVLINTHMLQAAQEAGVERYFYSSSACVYNADKQRDADNPGLKEEDAYPAMAEDGYGWEKLFSERMCRHFREDYGMCDARGPFPQRLRALRHLGRRPREGAGGHLPQGHPGQAGGQARNRHLGRRQADAQLHVHRRLREGHSDDHGLATFSSRINLGSAEMVTINQLVDIVEDIAGVKLKRTYDLGAPKGVNGRNSDNTLIKKYLGWEPGIRCATGLEKTYALDLRPVHGAQRRPARGRIEHVRAKPLWTGCPSPGIT